MRGPGDEHPLRVTVLFRGIDPSAGGLHASWFVGDESRGCPEMKRGEPQLTVLAKPAFDKVSAIIVQTHRNEIPSDHDLVADTAGLHVGRWPVELRVREQRADLRDISHVSVELQEFSFHPTEVNVIPWVYVDPTCILVATEHRDSIPWVKTPLVEVC